MAEINQFGNARAGGLTPDCGRCEKDLTDAIDGTLTAEEQALFDAHLRTCPECEQMFADAQRGHAWLGMLRSHRPEPPADLVGRILSRTSGLAALELPAQQTADGLPMATALAPGMASALPQPLAFPRRAERPRASLYGLLQTRFAMTAAMAFFSVALTLNLTGIRLSSVRARDFQPSSLRRDVSEVNAHVLRYYESLRVVYELESRVREMQHGSEPETLAQPQPTQPAREQQPAKNPGSSPAPADGHARSSGRAHAPTSGPSRSPAAVDSLSLPADQAHPLPSTPTPGRAIPVLLPSTRPAWQKGRLA